MPFTDSCKNVSLQGATLSAECRLSDGTYKHSTIALDNFLGNNGGVFKWPSKDWSKSARNPHYRNGVLSAELKGAANEWIPSTFNLNDYLVNNNGVLEVISPPVNGVNRTTIVASSMSRTDTNETLVAKEEKWMETSVKRTTVSSYEYQKTIVLSACKKLEVSVEGILTAHFSGVGGEIKIATMKLNDVLGNIDGRLTWGGKDFTKSCTELSINGTRLSAKCKCKDQKETRHSSIDLSVKIHCNGDRLEMIRYNEELSVALSEVPWMKFRVIAEPDFSVLYTNAAIKGTMHTVAQRAVQHVVTEMSRKISSAIEEAVASVTVSAVEFISQTMEVMLLDISGAAHIEPSCSEAAHLQTMSQELKTTFLKKLEA